jgi:nicotinamide-nucleotide amidase
VSEKSAVIISVGTELTEGIIRDSHGAFLSSELTRRNVSVRRIEQLPDDENLLSQFSRAVADADLLIITGGLGPTTDDITREVCASLFGTALELREDVWEMMIKRYPALSGRANRRQAMIPGACEALDNPFGTAPGFTGVLGTTRVFALPGPPKELTGMSNLYLFPFLEKELKLSAREVTEASLFLIGESRLEDACRALADSNPVYASMSWGTRVQEYRISLYLRGSSEEVRLSFLQALQKRFGAELVQPGDVTADSLLSAALLETGASFAAAESCTGGLLGVLLTAVPGSSAYFLGSCASYADSFKEKFLHVPREIINRYGAVSEECARAMAEGVLAAGEADWACSITGIAGPSGGTDEKPVGTVWIGLAGKGMKSLGIRFLFGYNRDSIRRRSVVAAMVLTEKYLRGLDALDMCRFWQYS